MNFPTIKFSNFYRLAVLLSFLTICVGCTKTNNVIEVLMIGTPGKLFSQNTPQEPGAQMLRGATSEGLVGLDEKGQVVPALAQSWIVTDDGISYIFRLHEGKWPDGTPINAENASTALRQAIVSLKDKSLASDLKSISQIRAMTDRVIEIELTSPQPDLLSLIAQPELGLQRKGRGLGPMRMTREKNIAMLTPIPPEQRGMPASEEWSNRARRVRLQAVSSEQAYALFKQGKAQVVLGNGIAGLNPPNALGFSRNTLKFDPVEGLFGLAITHQDGFLAKAANREAVSKGLNRENITANFGLNGWKASAKLFPTAIEISGFQKNEPWDALGLEERQAQAAAQIKRWHAISTEPLTLRIAMPNGPGTERLFSSLADDLLQIGIIARRASEGGQADLRLIDTTARYPRIEWYFEQFSCKNWPAACNSEVDRLVQKASVATDNTARAKYFSQAADKLSEAHLFIPFGPPIRWSLVRADETGFAPNRLGHHPLMSLAMRPR